MDAIERIEKSTERTSKIVHAVKADNYAAPTPCSELDVRGVLNHLLGGLDMLKAAADGGKPAMPDGEQFDADPGKVYDERRAKLLESMRAEGVLDRNWEMPFGSMPGTMMAGIAFWEHLVHGWDLAKATGQDTTIPDDLANEALELVTPMDAMLRMPGVCGPKVEVPESASVTDRLVGFLGRQP